MQNMPRFQLLQFELHPWENSTKKSNNDNYTEMIGKVLRQFKKATSVSSDQHVE